MYIKKNADNEKLLKFAGKKLGISPENLKNNIESGNFDALGIPEDKKRQIGEILNDREALEKILSNPNLQKLLDSITKGGR